jgi:tetratricopeptide (TPR) repeat protein
MLTHALLVTAVAAQAGASVAVPTDALGQAYFLFLQGRLREGRDDLTGAIDNYRQALEILPDATDIRVELASAYARRGQLADARAQAERVVALAPANREAHRLLGLIEAAALDRRTATAPEATVASAIDHLERSLIGAGSDAAVQLTLGELYVRDGRPDRAVAILQRVLTFRPDNERATELLVQAYRANGQTAEADQLASTLASSARSMFQARRRAAEQFEDAGNWAQAAEAWEQLVRSGPAGAAYRSRQALALARAGDLDGSRDVLEAATRATPNDIDAWYLLVQIEIRARRFDAADAAAARIGAIDPRDPRGALTRAQVQFVRGNDRAAIAILEPRIRSASDEEAASEAYVDMVGQLSAAFTRLGEDRRAVETLERATKRAPESEELLFSLAAAYERRRQFNQAERVFRSLIETNPTHDRALNYLGYMLADRGQKLDEAVQLINRALAIDEDNPSYLDSLGWAYFRLKRLEDARGPLERAAAAMPQSSVVQDHLGDLYFQMKRYDDAVNAFERALVGDRDGVEASDITGKRDRARALAGK